MLRVLNSESLPIRSSEDIVLVRQAVRTQAVSLGFGLVDQTKLVTASSELARNTLDYGGGGAAQLEVIQNDQRAGLAGGVRRSRPGHSPTSNRPSQMATPPEADWGSASADPSACRTNLRFPRNPAPAQESLF